MNDAHTNPPEEVTKKGQLEKKSSNIGSRGWKQYTFILNKDTLRYVHEHTHESTELRCADIVAIHYSSNAKDATFPITIHSKRRKLHLRAQSKADHTSWMEAFTHIICCFASPDEQRSNTPSNPLLHEPPPSPSFPAYDYDNLSTPPGTSPNVPRRRLPVPQPGLPPGPDFSPIIRSNSHDSMTRSPSFDLDGYVILHASNSADHIGVYDTISQISHLPSAKNGNHTSELAAQINKCFTGEQVLGLTDMLSRFSEQNCGNGHLYVNLEMLLEAVAFKAADINQFCTDDYQVSRPDWAKASTDNFNICDLVGIDIVAHISPSSITGKKKIGEGQFGEVFVATLHGQSAPIEVAVKTYKNIHNCTHEAKFMKEMAQLSQLVHPNIVRMYGIVIEDGQFPAMVMEYLPYADLKTFLAKNTRSIQKLVKYMIDIAMAMNYVSEKGLVHRDLAARNVLVDDNELCKVGDFGLLQELPENSDIYVPQSDDPLPFRWLALESLTERRFSVASDVWSYGILMWEMFKPTKVPYEDFQSLQLVSKLKDGYRLPLPRGIPQVLGNIMNACWKEDPSKRPSFLLICTVLTTKALMLKEDDYTYGCFTKIAKE